MELTDADKRVYNAYHIAARKAANKPFKVRKNFDKLEESAYVHIKKLSSFFEMHPNLSMDAFFIAPYKVYDDVGYLGLDYFLTRKAITCYTLYQKQLADESPDNDAIIEQTKEGLIHLYKYCTEHNVLIEDYKRIPNIPLVHLRDRLINFYIIHALDIKSEIYILDVDWREFYLTDFDNLFQSTYVKYLQSTKLKRLIAKSLEQIEQKLKENKINE